MFPTTAKILVVDDMKTMRKLVMKQLADLGFKNVVEADDGDTAWNAVQQAAQSGQGFDLIISDWNMPRVKGIDLLRKVRANASTKSVPFLMVTAEVEASSLKEASAPDARVSGFLNKPFRAEDLKTQLGNAFAARPKKAA